MLPLECLFKYLSGLECLLGFKINPRRLQQGKVAAAAATEYTIELIVNQTAYVHEARMDMPSAFNIHFIRHIHARASVQHDSRGFYTNLTEKK